MSIHWRLRVEAGSEEAARRILDSVGAALGADPAIESLTPAEGLFEARLTTEPVSLVWSQMVFDAMRQGQSLSDRWVLLGHVLRTPHAASTRCVVPGVSWIEWWIPGEGV